LEKKKFARLDSKLINQFWGLKYAYKICTLEKCDEKLSDLRYYREDRDLDYLLRNFTRIIDEFNWRTGAHGCIYVYVYASGSHR